MPLLAPVTTAVLPESCRSTHFSSFIDVLSNKLAQSLFRP